MKHRKFRAPQKNRAGQFALAAAVIAGLRAPAHALTFNLTYGPSVTGLLQASKFEAAINYAALQYEEMYSNPITINITVNDLNIGATALGKSFSGNTNTTYGALRNALSISATTFDQVSNLEENWPTTDPTGSNSDWYVNTAEAKAVGLMGPSSASDGTFDFSNTTTYALDPYDRAVGNENSGSFDLIGVAEHEFSELMGREGGQGIPDTAGKPAYEAYDLIHYTAPGVRDFSGTAGGDYFSIDAGTTNLKAFNSVAANGDLTDWDNGYAKTGVYVPDSYNAQSFPGVANTLSPVDATAMDILGYNRTSTSLTYDGGGFGDFLTGGNWFSSSAIGINPFHGTSMLINSAGGTAYHEFTPGENFELASNSDMGQSVEVSAGTLELNDSGSVTGIGMGLLIDQDGLLKVDGNGSFYSEGTVSMANTQGVTNAEAEFAGSAVVILGNPVQGTSFVVGSAGTALVTQTDSSDVQTPTLVLGASTYGDGIYQLNSTSSLAVAGIIYDGYFSGATGSMTQSDSSVVQAQSLILGYFQGSSGGYLLNNTSTLKIGGDEDIGYGGSGQFAQFGGTNTVTGNLVINAFFLTGITASYQQSGGILNAGGVMVNQYGSFLLDGGDIVTNTVQINGGSMTETSGVIDANVSSTGTFTYEGGFLLGSFTNNGTLNIDANFTIAGGLINEAPLSLTPGITLTLDELGLDNESTLSISGGTIAGSGTKTNNSIIQGTGTFSGEGALVNNGTIAESFGPLVFEPNGNADQNNGAITLEPTFGELDITSTSVSASNILINSGSITMNGAVVDGSDQLDNASGGTITGAGKINTSTFANDAGGVITLGSGELTIVPAFNNNGTISVPTGATVFAQNGISFNTGSIILAGGTFDSNGFSYNNSGSISGFGTLNAGSIQNGVRGNGSMSFTTGNTVINANVSNLTSMTFTADAVATITGNLNSSGSIQVNGAELVVDGSCTTSTYTSSNSSSNLFYGNVTISGFSAQMTGGDTDYFYMFGGTVTNNGTFANTGSLLSEGPIINNGTFTQTGTLNQYANFTNNATATIGGAQTWLPGTVFNNTAGIATLLTDAGSASAATLSVNVTGGILALGSSQHWAALSVSGGGQLDVSNHSVIIDYGSGADPIASIAAYLASGYAGGAWDGPGVMTSAPIVFGGLSYGLGYADSADAGNPAGLASGTIEIKYTLLGDADLSGVVNGIDFGILAANFNKGVTGWDQGDFDYNNIVNGVDFAAMAANFNKGASGADFGPSALNDPAIVAFAEAHGLMADVPEPVCAGLVLAPIAGCLLGRQRSRQPRID